MLLLNEPSRVIESRFVITEDEAFFYPVGKGKNTPTTMDILAQLFDLGDPDVLKDVSGKLFNGEIVRGHYDPSIRQFEILGPVEPNADLWERIVDVFEDWTN